MVKRGIAIVVGAACGVLLWYVVAWARAAAEPTPISIENCVRDAYVDCVGQETGPVLPEAGPDAVAQPCKDWLSDESGTAALSQCLHEARRGQDAMRIANFKRAQRIAASN